MKLTFFSLTHSKAQQRPYTTCNLHYVRSIRFEQTVDVNEMAARSLFKNNSCALGNGGSFVPSCLVLEHAHLVNERIIGLGALLDCCFGFRVLMSKLVAYTGSYYSDHWGQWLLWISAAMQRGLTGVLEAPRMGHTCKMHWTVLQTA